MNWFQKKICPAPTEIVKEVIKEVPVYVNPTEHERLIRDIKETWNKFQRLNERADEAGIRLEYSYCEPLITGQYLPSFYIGNIKNWSLKIVASYRKVF